jgi:2-keto-3-deoxy-L-rhamnonate aldolase RhmA
MGSRAIALALSFGVLAVSMVGQAQSQRRINPMVALHEKGLPVFGITHPAIVAGGRGRGAGPGGTTEATAAPATPPAQPSLMDAARETMSYKFADFAYNNYSSANADRFLGYMAALIAAGGSVSSHAFISKVPIIHTDPAAATARIVEQLNAGHAGVMMQQVESADEVRTALAAMRFKSKGGTRPDEGYGLAAAYWGLTKEQYREKADPWPLNKNGELVLWAIVESKKGIANVREIAAVPGLTVLTVGAGTLGGVFSSTGADGQRVRDQAGFDAAVASVIAACKEFKVACSYPANNPAEIEKLMSQGFTVFTMQGRNPAGFDAIAAGRRLAGRPVPTTER